MNSLKEWIDSHDIDVNSKDSLLGWLEVSAEERNQIMKDMEKTQVFYRSQANDLISIHARIRYLQLALEKAPV